jgi:integrase
MTSATVKNLARVGFAEQLSSNGRSFWIYRFCASHTRLNDVDVGKIAVIRVRAIKRLPRVFSPVEVQSLLDACTRLRDRLLLCLLHESGMRIGQALGLRHADMRSYDGAIDIVPRANSNGALGKRLREPYGSRDASHRSLFC